MALRTTPDVYLADNVTSPPARLDIAYLTYYYGILTLLTVTAVIGNSIALYAFFARRTLRVPVNYFLISLCVCDLLLSVVYSVYNVSHIDSVVIRRAMGGWLFCTTWITLTITLISASSYHLVGITVIRYLSIRRPLHFPVTWSHARAVASCLGVWAGLVGLNASLFFRPGQLDRDYDGVCRFELFLGLFHIFYITIFLFIIPIIIMATLYILVAREAKKHVRAIVEQEQSIRSGTSAVSTRRHMIKRELRMFKVLGILLGVYVIAWTPFVVFEFLSIKCNEHAQSGCSINKYIRASVRLLLHANTAANVFVYAYRLPEVKVTLRKLFCCDLHTSKVTPNTRDLALSFS